MTKSSAQLLQLQKAWLDAAGGWNEQREQADRDARQSILRLGLMFAEKIVQRVVQVDSEVVVDQLAEAISYVLRPTDVTIRINAADRPTIDEALPALLKGLSNLQHVDVVDDDSISRGGCVVTYGQGRIDATIDTQMRRLVEMLIPDATTSAALDVVADVTADVAVEPQVNHEPPAPTAPPEEPPE
jgi:flagellar biosynthesis/type III secretory pathway protein FliH